MYDDIAKSYNDLHGAEQERKLEKLLAYVQRFPDMSVADIGCGTAHLAKFFSECTYVGVDPSQGMLDQAPESVKTKCAPGEDIPLKDNSQDLVVCLTALHNYGDPEAGILELVRIAKGQVLVGVLKKSASHDIIVATLTTHLHVEHLLDDQHDTLLVLRKL